MLQRGKIVPLSISNSKERIPPFAYGRLWCVVLLLVGSIFGAAEFGLRALGYRPSVVDDFDLWCQQRVRCVEPDTQNSILLIGSSRAAADIDPSMLAELMGRDEAINLSLSGKGCYATLRNVAEQTDFRGLVLCTAKPSQIRLDNGQAPWTAYYHRNFENLGRIEKQVNRNIKTWLQEWSVAVNPPLMAMKRSLEYGQFCARGQIGTANRQTKLQYDRMPPAYLERIRSSRVDQQLKRLQGPPPSFEEWQTNLEEFKRLADIIVGRGGTVVLVRLPTTEEYLEVDYRRYPRDEFWAAIEDSAQLDSVHFEDIPGMNEIECPETSHISENSIAKCTELLAGELKRLGL